MNMLLESRFTLETGQISQSVCMVDLKNGKMLLSNVDYALLK
jgi:hypothetical protein